jgi:ribosomal protein L7/L12
VRPYTRIADPVSLTQDFTHLQSISREEQQEQLRELATRGQLVTAIYMARKLYGGTLMEAKQLVEGLAEGERRTNSPGPRTFLGT